MSFRVSVWFMVSVMICRYSLCDHAHSARGASYKWSCSLSREVYSTSVPFFGFWRGVWGRQPAKKHIYVIHVRVEWAVGLGGDNPRILNYRHNKIKKFS